MAAVGDHGGMGQAGSPEVRVDGARLRRTGLLLLAVNAIPLVGVVAFGWSLAAVMVLFWLENLVIGCFQVLKMITARPPLPPELAAAGFPVGLLKVLLALFFALHYGGFTLVHGLFVYLLFSGALQQGAGVDMVVRLDATGSEVALAAGTWVLAVLGLIVSHGHSFVVHFLRGGERERSSLIRLLFSPYGRVAVMHTVILVGAFGVMLLGAPIIALVALVVLKTGLDFVSHTLSHTRWLPSRESAGSGAPTNALD